MKIFKQYLVNHLWAADRWLNVLFLGSSQQFISTRIYEHKTTSIICGWLYQILNWIDENHCENAASKDNDPDHAKYAIWK